MPDNINNDDNDKKMDKIRRAMADYEWHAVSRPKGTEEIIADDDVLIPSQKNACHVNEVEEKASFANEKMENADFHGASLIKADFSGATLKGADFSGVDLTDANLSGVDLSGANLSGAILKRANFTGACLNGVILKDADLEDAILLDIGIDEMGLEELQALIEYLAKYFPHKLNLSRMNLTLLDLRRIDLKSLNLRGVDFTGVDFTGVSLVGLNLSECKITPEQIAQAMGRVPSRDELDKLMTPRNKGGKGAGAGIDWEDFFFNDGKEIGVWDTTKDKGVGIDKILKMGKAIFRQKAEKPKIKDEQIVEQVKTELKSKENEHNEKVREVIEKNRLAVLESRKEKQKEFEEVAKEEKTENKHKEIDVSLVRGRGSMER